MKRIRMISIALLALLLTALLSVPVYAADAEADAQIAAEEVQTAGTETGSTGLKAIAVGVAIGLAAAGGAVGMGIVGGKAADGISRQPEMEGKIRTTLMLDLVFIETAIIYALLVVILVIFVL